VPHKWTISDGHKSSKKFCLHIFTDAEWRWRYVGGWLYVHIPCMSRKLLFIIEKRIVFVCVCMRIHLFACYSDCFKRRAIQGGVGKFFYPTDSALVFHLTERCFEPAVIAHFVSFSTVPVGSFRSRNLHIYSLTVNIPDSNSTLVCSLNTHANMNCLHQY
jgi:hypothetical protein